MLCSSCLSSTRVFGLCTRCGPKPGAAVTSPTLRWFLDTLAEQPEWTLTEYDCLLIREAAVGYERAEHRGRQDVFSPAAVLTGAYEGTVGGKHEWAGLQCERVQFLGTGEYGDRYLITFRSAAGNVVVWFTGEGGKFDPKPGQAYNVRASVKAHQPYGGVCQTVIQRPKVI